jgi:prolipoprotein diacylglyceryltransferase
LAEFLGLLALSLALFFYLKKSKFKGRAFGLYLLGAGALRALMEQFRGDFRGPPVFGQAPTFWIALLAIGLGVFIFAKASARGDRFSA